MKRSGFSQESKEKSRQKALEGQRILRENATSQLWQTTRRGLTRSQTPALRRTRIRQRPRTPEETAWRLQVLANDKYVCRLCHQPGDLSMDAHHIAQRSLRPDLVLVLSNGCALHRACHIFVHENPEQAVARGLLDFTTYEIAQKMLQSEAAEHLRMYRRS